MISTKDKIKNPPDLTKSRKSHCSGCGKRLSYETPMGKIQWRVSFTDDDGIWCQLCNIMK
jgi:hypothetical protein